MGKTLRSRKSTAVQGTNDSSSVSKASMAYRGYFDDDFIQYFVKKKSNGHNVVRSPLINRGYYIRNFVLNKIICNFLNHFNDAGINSQIISIGSGFDSTFFRLKHQGMIRPGTLYAEVDFPELQKRKLSLINDAEILKCYAGENVNVDLKDCPELKSSITWNGVCYKMIGCDVTETSRLLRLLLGVGLRTDSPTLVLSEVVITYLHVHDASNVISWFSKTFENAAFVTYEQIYPDDEFGKFMCKHFQKLGSPLKSIFAFPTLDAQTERYLKQGWQLCSASTMSHFYLHDLPLDERLRIDSLEMFDEHEEWMLKCNHYFVLTATQGVCRALDELIWKERSSESVLESGVIEANCQDGAIPQGIGADVRETFIRKSKSNAIDASPCDVTPAKVESHFGVCCVHDVEEVALNFSRYGHASCVLKVEGEDHVIAVGGFGDAYIEEQSNSKATKDDHDDSLTTKSCTVERTTNSEPSLDENPDKKVMHCRLKQMTSFNLSQNIGSLPPISKRLNRRFVEESTRSSIFERLHASCTPLSNGRLLVFGGRRSPQAPCSSLILLSFGGDRLVEVSVAQLTESPRLEFRDVDSLNCGGVEEVVESQVGLVAPSQRWRHSATLVNLPRSTAESEEVVIIHGGINRSGRTLGDTWLLSTSTWNWSHPPSGLPRVGVHSHSSDWWAEGHSLVTSGGVGADGRPRNCIRLFDLASFEWKSLKCAGRLEERFSHTSHVVGDLLILVGGVAQTNPSPGISIVNLRSGVFQNFVVPLAIDKIQCRPPVYQFHNHTSHLLMYEGTDRRCAEILVLGGGGNYFSFGTKVRRGCLRFRVHLPPDQ